MRSAGFKQKSYTATLSLSQKGGSTAKVVISKKKVKKPRLKSISQLKKELWLIVAKRIKERDKNICFTSGKYVEGANAHCGHGIPSSVCGARLRYHPKNLHVQSYYENIHASGNGGVYYRNQVKLYGQETMDKIYDMKQKLVRADRYFYTTLIDLYKNGTWEDIELFLENAL